MREELWKVRVSLKSIEALMYLNGWLLFDERARHVVMVYFNKPTHALVVLNDRDTALQLKLALP